MDVYTAIRHEEPSMSSCVDKFCDLRSGITSQHFLEVSKSAWLSPVLKVWPSQVLDHLTHTLSIGVFSKCKPGSSALHPIQLDVVCLLVASTAEACLYRRFVLPPQIYASTAEAYSMTGLTRVVQSFPLIYGVERDKFFRKKASVLLALVLISPICFFHDKSFVMVTPRYLAFLTSCKIIMTLYVI